MSNFPFVSDEVLKNNLDIAFDHIVDLLTLSESEDYKYKEPLVSSLRKTIVIHTASIIEALLLWKLKQKIKEHDVELSDEWKYFNVKIIHKINATDEIVGAQRKKEKKRIDQLDFVRIIDLNVKHEVITKIFAKKLHTVRKLRNRLHIGGLLEMEKKYKKSDLEFVFNVASDVKKIVSK